MKGKLCDARSTKSGRSARGARGLETFRGADGYAVRVPMTCSGMSISAAMPEVSFEDRRVYRGIVERIGGVVGRIGLSELYRRIVRVAKMVGYVCGDPVVVSFSSLLKF